MSAFNQNPYPFLNSTSSTTPPLQTASSASSGGINLNDQQVLIIVDRLARLETAREGIEKNIETHTSELKDHNGKISTLVEKSNTKPFHESGWFKLISGVTVVIVALVGWFLNNCYNSIQDLQDKVITLEQQRPSISSQAQPKK